MRAIVQDGYGDAPEDVLRSGDAARPTIGPDEVLVEVHAASVDRGTWHIMTGLPYPIRLAGFGLRRPKALNPGRAVAGTVVEAGERATSFRPGDAVYGTAEGAFAEYARARAGRAVADHSFGGLAASRSEGFLPRARVGRERVDGGRHPGPETNQMGALHSADGAGEGFDESGLQ